MDLVQSWRAQTLHLHPEFVSSSPAANRFVGGQDKLKPNTKAPPEPAEPGAPTGMALLTLTVAAPDTPLRAVRP